MLFMLGNNALKGLSIEFKGLCPYRAKTHLHVFTQGDALGC